MTTWKDVEAWRHRHDQELWKRRVQFLRLGWTLLPLEDGEWCARRVRPDDEENGTLFLGEPELRAPTFEQLLMEVSFRRATVLRTKADLERMMTQMKAGIA